MNKKYKKLGEKKLNIKDNVSGYDKHILIKTFRLPNGIIENFFIEDAKDSVQIFPITDDNRVITVKQFRPGLEKDNFELPGGGLEEKEDIHKAALRELKEETGFEGDLVYLGTIPYNPYSTGKRHSFAAINCKRINKLNLDDNEFLKVIIWPMDKFKKMMKKGYVRGADCAYMGLHQLGLIDFKS